MPEITSVVPTRVHAAAEIALLHQETERCFDDIWRLVQLRENADIAERRWRSAMSPLNRRIRLTADCIFQKAIDALADLPQDGHIEVVTRLSELYGCIHTAHFVWGSRTMEWAPFPEMKKYDVGKEMWPVVERHLMHAQQLCQQFDPWLAELTALKSA